MILPSSSDDPEYLIYKANMELQKASKWISTNLLTLNAQKKKYIFFKKLNCHLHLRELSIGGDAISRIGESCEEKSF